MISSVAPEVIEGGVEKCKGNLASFWRCSTVLTSSTHPVVFEGLHVWTAFVLFSHKLVILKSFRKDFWFYFCLLYFPFSDRQLPPLSKKMPFFCGCDPGAPLLVSTKAATCSGACQIPQQLVNLSWDGVSSPAGLRCSNPASSFFGITCFVVILTAVPAHRLLLPKLVPTAAAYFVVAVGLTAAHSPGFGVWIQLCGVWLKCLCVVDLTVFDNNTFTDNSKCTLKTEQWHCRIVPTHNVVMGQTAGPYTCEPYLWEFLPSCCCNLWIEIKPSLLPNIREIRQFHGQLPSP